MMMPSLACCNDVSVFAVATVDGADSAELDCERGTGVPNESGVASGLLVTTDTAFARQNEGNVYRQHMAGQRFHMQSGLAPFTQLDATHLTCCSHRQTIDKLNFPRVFMCRKLLAHRLLYIACQRIRRAVSGL